MVLGSLLPPDTIFDILLRLPVRALCKFRCVSKSWSAMISDPNFREQYYQLSKQNCLLITKVSSISDTLHFYSFDNRCGLRLVNEISDPLQHVRDSKTNLFFSHLELVCMYRDSGTQEAVCVCNPSTGDTLVLPETTYKDPWFVAFGYLPSIGVYKVLRIFLHDIAGDGNYDWGAEVFTLECDDDCCSAIGDDWRTVSNPQFEFDCASFVDGAIYFLPKYYSLPDYSVGISRFDLEQEEWSVLPFPDAHYFVPKNPVSLMLAEMGGALSLIDYSWESYQKLVDIWLLNDYDNGVWVKEYSIDFTSFVREKFIYPFAIMEDGRVLIETEGKRVLLYDPNSEDFEDLGIDRKIYIEANESFHTSFYVKSFMSFEK